MDKNLIDIIEPTVIIEPFMKKDKSLEMITSSDLIYINSLQGVQDKQEREKLLSMTDFAFASGGIAIKNENLNRGFYWTRTALLVKDEWYGGESYVVKIIHYNGTIGDLIGNEMGIGNVPNMRLNIDKYLEYAISRKQPIFSEKYNNKKLVGRTIEFGEYPRSKVDKKMYETLESLYNCGDIKRGLTATGQWITSYASMQITNSFLDKTVEVHNPIFEYNGKKYTRSVCSQVWEGEGEYIKGTHQTIVMETSFPDGEKLEKEKAYWFQVEPLEFNINNWDSLPTSINPLGDGTATTIDISATEISVATIPFCSQESNDSGNIWQNSCIRSFLNGISVDKNFTNGEQYAIPGMDIINGNNFLNEAFNASRAPITEYTLPEDATTIGPFAFAGCTFLKQITIPDSTKITGIGEGAFADCKFKYLTVNEDNSAVFSVDEPKNNQGIIYDLTKFQKAFSNIPIAELAIALNVPKLYQLANTLIKNKATMPYNYVEFMPETQIDYFNNMAYFKFFNKELGFTKKMLEEESWEEVSDFYKFATCLGCFSIEKIRDKHGKLTGDMLCHKASVLLKQLIESKTINIGEFHRFFDSLYYGTQIGQEFYNFLSVKPKGKAFQNAELLVKMERQYPGIFVNAMSDFDSVIKLRTSLDEHGKPITLSWEEALKAFHTKKSYINVSPENSELADVFLSKGLSQETFAEAVNLHEEARAKSVPKHILSGSLKEDTILESIEKIRARTSSELLETKDIIEELYAKQFTYEMLDKSSPYNAIMGIYCSCCGTITSGAYGKNIARASVLAQDVQNIVVKNDKSEIISKGTLYVNSKLGYGVINDFELNEQYRSHESSAGRYTVEDDNIEEQTSQLIFNAFMRGIKDFVKQYDLEHPEKPIEKIVVGMGYNRLKKQCEEFAKATKNLTVPDNYSFKDALTAQHILYDRSKEKPIQKEGELEK